MMKINGMELASYSVDSVNEVHFWLSNTTIKDALALDVDNLVITNGDVEERCFSGYTLASVSLDGELVHIQMIRNIDPRTQEEIDAMKEEIATLKAQITNLTTMAIQE